MSQFDSGKNRFTAGLGSVGSYQVSGVPWITGTVEGLALGSEHKVSFPTVAKSVTVINNDVGSTDIHVHFNSKAVDNNVSGGLHYVPLNEKNDSMTFSVKCKEIYVSAPTWGAGTGATAASYTVVAELTGIDTAEMFLLTGSGLTTIDGS